MPAFEYYHDWDLQNVDLARTLENYLMRGFEPGGFTTAVLANDLFGAFARADHWNKKAIADLAQAVVHFCPASAVGSYEAVQAWCADLDERRSKYATWKLLQGPVKQEIDNDDVPF